MDGKTLRYFAGGNTAKGFYSLYDSNLADLDRVFILTGRSTAEKTEIIHRLINKWEQSDFQLEVIHSANSQDELDGLIIRELGIAIVDGDQPRILGKDYVGDQWETIDLDQAGRTLNLEGKMNEVAALKEKMNDAYIKAYESYEAGLKVHDDWEEIYIGRMDFEKANAVAQKVISALFKEDALTDTESRTIRRFLGAATPAGPVDFVNNITEGLTYRYFLKGRAGTGKSTFLKKIVAEAKSKGYNTEVYHCGFDPESLDMVLVRELGWAIFDSTQPHEYFPERPGDEIIDMYELTVTPGTDEAFADEIAKIEAKYREKMADGKKYLAEAKSHRDELEKIYCKVTDRSYIDDIFSEIDGEIQLLATRTDLQA